MSELLQHGVPLSPDVDPVVPGASDAVKEAADVLLIDGTEVHKDCFYEGSFSMLDLFVRNKVDSAFDEIR